MRSIFISFLLIFSIVTPKSASAAINKKINTITYLSYSNSKQSSDQKIYLRYHEGIVYLSDNDDKIRYFQDLNKGVNIDIIRYNNELFMTSTSMDSISQPSFTDITENILGYECKHAVYNSFSNKIEVWYTEETKVKGSLYRNYLPNKNAAVLKVLINGSREIRADSIYHEKIDVLPAFPTDKSKHISGPEFEELKIKSRYTSIKIFDNDTLNFNPKRSILNHNDSSESKTFHYSNGTVLLRKIKLPEIFKKGAYCYARLSTYSQGDAYDRTGSVFVIPEIENKLSMLNAMVDSLEILPIYTDNDSNFYQGIVSTSAYDTPIEIMRFFTPFGVGHFNSLREINNYPWKSVVEYKQEVTDLIPNDIDEVWIGVFIGNYDGGGHNVSLEFDFYPAWEEIETNKWVQPLFSTINIMEMSGQNYGKLFGNDSLKVDFEIADDLENIRLYYTSTGHGGWGGGDEFNPKLNQLLIDGEEVFSIIPWRTDCATYRMYNPASGNFSNGLSSSDLSRSNWCPATISPPYYIELPNLKPGKHILEVIIDQGENDGGSFSHWSVSGILVGEKLVVEGN